MSGRPPCPAPPPPAAASGSPLEITAAPSWRCIDFISDLHLHAGRPRTFAALAAYLDQTDADALFNLGDLFEAWVGDDMRHEPFEAECVRVLADAARTRCLYLMVGNRDFLMGQALAAACGAHLLDDPTVLAAFGQRHLLTHGDAWCLADTEYLAFRRQVRDAQWQRRFLTLPLAARLDTARGLRTASEARKDGMRAETWADVDEAHAARHLAAAQAHSLIHGHTHRPASADFALPGVQRHVLSDWELDEAPLRAEVLRLDASGFRRLPRPLPA